MSFVLEHMRNNLWRGKFSSFPEDLCVHGLTGRLGGVSKKPYDSLNMALHVGDNPEDVWENRRRFLHALGLKAEDMVTPEQIHGQHTLRLLTQVRLFRQTSQLMSRQRLLQLHRLS